MADICEAIKSVQSAQPRIIEDLLHEIFADSKCFNGYPSCGKCQACRFITAVDERLRHDTDPSIGPSSSDPVEYADTIVSSLSLAPPTVPRDVVRQIAFNLVADKEDWRNLIATTLHESVMAEAGVTIDDVRDAIEHYTAARPSVLQISDTVWLIKAAGARDKASTC